MIAILLAVPLPKASVVVLQPKELAEPVVVVHLAQHLAQWARCHTSSFLIDIRLSRSYAVINSAAVGVIDMALALAPRQKPPTPFVRSTSLAVSATVDPAGITVCIRVRTRSSGLVATAAIDPDIAPDMRDVAMDAPTLVHRSSASVRVGGEREAEVEAEAEEAAGEAAAAVGEGEEEGRRDGGLLAAG